MSDNTRQCSGKKMSDEFAPVIFQCQNDAGHEGPCDFPTDTDFAVLSQIADRPAVGTLDDQEGTR